MRKIILVCSAGMSTSLLMGKMNDYAQSIAYEAEVNAYPMAEIDERGQAADVILLGPQVRFNLKKVQALFPDKPVESIDIQAYGLMDGKQVIEQVKTLLKD